MDLQAEDGIRDLVRGRGLGDVYKKQLHGCVKNVGAVGLDNNLEGARVVGLPGEVLEIRGLETRRADGLVDRDQRHGLVRNEVNLSLIHC